MRTIALLLLLGCATLAQAQPPKTYTPGTPPRPGEETILNARVVSVDRVGSRITVRGVDVKADGGSNETFTVAAPAASRLADLKPGMEVLLTLRGTTIIDVKVSVGSGGESGNVIRGNTQGTFTLQGSPAPASSPTSPRTSKTARPPARATGTASPAKPTTLPATGSSPQPAAGGPVTGATPATAPVQVVPATGTRPVIGVVPVVGPPSPAPQGTPFPTPRPQPTPIPVGTPRPVLLPSEAPSPSQTPTPSPQVP